MAKIGKIGTNSRSHRDPRQLLVGLPDERETFEGKDKLCQLDNGGGDWCGMGVKVEKVLEI